MTGQELVLRSADKVVNDDDLEYVLRNISILLTFQLFRLMS